MTTLSRCADGFFGAINSLRQFSNQSAYQKGIVQIRQEQDGTYSFDSYFDNDTNYELHSTLSGAYEGFYEGFSIGDGDFKLKVSNIVPSEHDKIVLSDAYLPFRVQRIGAIPTNFIKWGQNGMFVEIMFSFPK